METLSRNDLRALLTDENRPVTQAARLRIAEALTSSETKKSPFAPYAGYRAPSKPRNYVRRPEPLSKDEKLQKQADALEKLQERGTELRRLRKADPELWDNKGGHNKLGGFIPRFKGVDKDLVPKLNPGYNREKNRGNQKITKDRVRFQIKLKNVGNKAAQALKLLGPTSLIEFGAFHQAFYPNATRVTPVEVFDFLAHEVKPFEKQYPKLSPHWEIDSPAMQAQRLSQTIRFQNQGGYPKE